MIFKDAVYDCSFRITFCSVSGVCCDMATFFRSETLTEQRLNEQRLETIEVYAVGYGEL